MLDGGAERVRVADGSRPLGGFYGEGSERWSGSAPAEAVRLSLSLGEFLLLGLQAVEEQCFVDSSLEDRDAHLHALRDDFAPVHPCLSSELGGRQVDRHLLPPRRLQT